MVIFVNDFVVVVGSVTKVTVDDTPKPKTFVAFISGTLVVMLDLDCCVVVGVVVAGFEVMAVGSTKILLISLVLFSFFSVGFGLVGRSGGLRLIGAAVVVVVVAVEVVIVLVVVVVGSVVGTNCSGSGTPETNGLMIC